MTSKGATPTEKLGNWKSVFDGIAPEITPEAWRQMVALADVKVGPDETPAAYAARVQLGVQMAKIVAANDRAATIAAAIITQSGVVRPIIDVEDE